MDHNADFTRRALVHATSHGWIDSPMKGVRRCLLDRVGDEVARATSLVEYAPGSHFSPHVHTGGEEFIVLEGVFQDEHGDYAAGSYIRNPPESRHTPGSEQGCIIFVKLWQFDLSDRTPVRTDMNKTGQIKDPTRSGVSVSTLFEDTRESVRLETWDANRNVSLDTTGGAEVFVLSGSFTESDDMLVKHSWLRIPDGGSFMAKTGTEGARVWIKTRHLRHVEDEIQRIDVYTSSSNIPDVGRINP